MSPNKMTIYFFVTTMKWYETAFKCKNSVFKDVRIIYFELMLFSY